MRLFHSLVTLAVVPLAVSVANSTTAAPLTFTDFEPAGFVVGGTVNNHRPDGTNPAPAISNSNQSPQAWFVGNASAGADQAIADFGGNKVWRLSQGNGTGSLGGAIQSPHMGMIAGETGALNDAGRGPVTTNTFYGQFDFRSATGAAQNGLQVNVTGASFDQRHGYVRIQDDGGGFDLVFYDTVGNSFNGNLLDLNLSYDDWHTVGIEIVFNDGFASGTFGDMNAVGNDVANVYVDGVLVYTGTSWESYYAAFQNHAESIDALQFSTGSAIASQLGGGLYFDNVIVTNQGPDLQQTPVPEPASIVVWAVATGALTLRIRRRRLQA